jgi:hypothetical protein
MKKIKEVLTPWRIQLKNLKELQKLVFKLHKQDQKNFAQ